VWSRGRVDFVKTLKLKIAYLNDCLDESIFVDKSSYMIAPYKTKSHNFDWRVTLKAGDLVDCEDHYGSWYGSTIVEIREKEEGSKLAKIIFKVYDDNGNKRDEKGRYYGIGGYG
jgi:hypothetical protein